MQGTLENNAGVFGTTYKKYKIKDAEDIEKVTENGLKEKTYNNNPRRFMELIEKSAAILFEIMNKIQDLTERILYGKGESISFVNVV